MKRCHRGDDAAAIETLRDVLKLAAIMRRLPTLSGALPALGTEGRIYGAIEGISPDLKILPAGSDADRSGGAATREAIESLIAELLDEKRLQQSRQWVWYSERAFILDIVRLSVDGQVSAPLSSVPSALKAVRAIALGPLYKKDILELLRMHTAMAEASSRPS